MNQMLLSIHSNCPCRLLRRSVTASSKLFFSSLLMSYWSIGQSLEFSSADFFMYFLTLSISSKAFMSDGRRVLYRSFNNGISTFPFKIFLNFSKLILLKSIFLFSLTYLNNTYKSASDPSFIPKSVSIVHLGSPQKE